MLVNLQIIIKEIFLAEANRLQLKVCCVFHDMIKLN